ncbi:MAG TPA: NAD(P)H-hydrate dehydratase [Chthoniobacteraceae bacterium]|nr:NAD(P)H-hydrate dehydratase [Chthoniobacteraceae bacterium]
MILTCEEMRAVEEEAFARGVEAEALMEEAGRRIAAAVRQFFPVAATCQVVYGKGNNGGDALVAARHLAEMGWRIRIEAAYPPAAWSPLLDKKFEELTPLLELNPPHDELPLAVILDGLLGTGASTGPLREPLRGAVERIDQLRESSGASVFAIDLPTGLDSETGAPGEVTVTADVTLAIGHAKTCLLADAALPHVGRLAVLPLSGLEITPGRFRPLESVATPQHLARFHRPRSFNLHKGDCGRVGIVAGSPGMTGAAVMAAHAAVRGGAGLVTLFVSPDAAQRIVPQLMPEVMMATLEDFNRLRDHSLDVLGIGPGLGPLAGTPKGEVLADLLATFPGTVVADADALNLLAADGQARRSVLSRRAGPRLLTPHPGEMARLFPPSSDLDRRETAAAFLAHPEVLGPPGAPPLALLLKGARTLVAEHPDAAHLHLSWNTTGNPGMATGGMGDILTGLTAALAAQGHPPFDAARIGAWIAGRAAELTVAQGWRSHESLSATDLLEFFGPAFHLLKSDGQGY